MQKFLARAFSFLGLGVFLVALWVLHDKVRELHWGDMAAAMQDLAPEQIAAALFFTVLSYFTISWYDVLALWSRGLYPPYRRIALTAFISHTLSHAVGFSYFTGGSIRYRLYRRIGLTGKDILHLISFNLLTFWLGLLSLGGIVFVLLPPAIPASLGFPLSARSLGVLFLLPLCVFLLLSERRGQLRIGKWSFAISPLRITLAQMVAGGADWLIGAAVVYFLLPRVPGLTYDVVLRAFLVAQIVGLTSQAPAGLGVFETLMLQLLPASLSDAHILGSLLLYRAIYTVLPFVVALVLFSVREVSAKEMALRTIVVHSRHWGRRLLRRPEKKRI